MWCCCAATAVPHSCPRCAVLLCVGNSVFAPLDFQMQVARVRSWRLDLIDASHLTETSDASAAEVNRTSPIGSGQSGAAGEPAASKLASKLPSHCAHLDAYLGVSYSLQFSAPWNIGIRHMSTRSADSTGPVRPSPPATRFVDPFGSTATDAWDGTPTHLITRQ